jgi:hypothetical protein
VAQTLKDIIAAAEKLDGKPAAKGKITVSVRPGSYLSDGRGGYEKDQVIRAVAVGSKSWQSHHIEAFLDAIGVELTDASQVKLAQLLAYTPKK